LSTFFGAEVDVGEALHDLVQQASGLKPCDLPVEVILVEDLAGTGGEAVVVIDEIAYDVGRVSADRGEALPGQVVELKAASCPVQDRVAVFNCDCGVFGPDRLTGGCHHAVQAAQHSEGQDDLAVL
jgi:hypothetical protein